MRAFSQVSVLVLAAVLAAASPSLAVAQPQPAKTAPAPLIPIQTFQLPNGLRVVFHIDRSDPVVAVVLAAHVGSAREEPGRTGFAHLFEHLFFLNSENLGPGGLDRMTARIGGSGANGSTSRDVTDYLQTVPNDALEKMIWAEADKIGYFINTVTDPVLAKEKQVVLNEKRQSYDNQPYGQTEPVIATALYSKDHPYSWPVIGSIADLNAAQLKDVQAFYHRWYTPNNTTLVIAGDFDPAQAKAWVEKYFGEIPRGPEAPIVKPRAAKLTQTVKLVHEDNFAQLPELTLAWPTVDRASPDRAPLEMLFTLLTEGKDAPLTATLVDDKKLTDEVGGNVQTDQVAGEAYLTIRAFDGVDLDAVQAGLDQGFKRFEIQGVDAPALARAKILAEAAFYARLDSVLGKGAALARYDAFGGSADQDLARLQAVTPADVMRVYRQYIAGKPHIATSFVPKGKSTLALAGSTKAVVVEEAIVAGAEAPIDPKAGVVAYTRTASSFDRTVEPPSGTKPAIQRPDIWTAGLANGVRISGIENDETPLVYFELTLPGGRLLDDPAKPGAANLVAQMFDRGTAKKTPAELENAFKSLGANIKVRAEDERFVISGRTLSRNFAPTVALVQEMLLEPRWDPTELALAKSAVVAGIQGQKSSPVGMANRLMDYVSFGPNHILSRNAAGTESSVAALTLDDLKAFQLNNFTPRLAQIHVVGALSQAQAREALGPLGLAWNRPEPNMPFWPAPQAPTTSKIYFYDAPGAKQSVLLFGYPAMRRSDPDFYPATVANFILGGGGFASRLLQQMRETKGYTYGVRTAFRGGVRYGDFQLFSTVRSNVTPEASILARDIMKTYSATFTDADMAVTRSALSNGRARALETAGAKLSVLENIGEYGLSADYLNAQAAIVDGITTGQIKTLAERYLRTDAMIYVVVGDAKTQAKGLESLGYGPVVMMNEALDKADK
jgi:zinc protease